MSKQTFFLGTYTRQESRGIYEIILNRSKKTLEDLKLISEVENPTYLSASKDGDLLFSVLKEGGEKGGVLSFKKAQDGHFQKIQASTEEGAAPCYVYYDPERSYLYSANYHKGEVALYKADPEGQLTLLDTKKHSGSSVHPNQDAPHAHYFAPSPDGRFLLACDLGTDEVLTYKIENNRLSLVSVCTMPAGTGPRHLVFHPHLDLLYVAGELNNQVFTLSYSAQLGETRILESISMLPKEFDEQSSAAAIRITSDGQNLYASNRGHDSIVGYSIDEKGNLQLNGYFLTNGRNPRDFDLDQTEKFLIVGHQDTPHLSLFERSASDGSLQLIQTDIYAPEVVCICGIRS